MSFANIISYSDTWSKLSHSSSEIPRSIFTSQNTVLWIRTLLQLLTNWLNRKSRVLCRAFISICRWLNLIDYTHFTGSRIFRSRFVARLVDRWAKTFFSALFFNFTTGFISALPDTLKKRLGLTDDFSRYFLHIILNAIVGVIFQWEYGQNELRAPYFNEITLYSCGVNVTVGAAQGP